MACAHRGDVRLYAVTPYGLGRGVGLHDRAQSAAVCAVFNLLYKRRMESASDTSEKAAAGINVIACSSNRLEKQDLIETHALPRLSYAVRRSFARAAYCYAELICITYRLK